jgi:hypothetical protein
MPGAPPHLLRRPGIHIHLTQKPKGFWQIWELRAWTRTICFLRLLAELQGLGHDGLLVMAKAATESNGGGHEHGGCDNALQTLHGLLSFG